MGLLCRASTLIEISQQAQNNSARICSETEIKICSWKEEGWVHLVISTIHLGGNNQETYNAKPILN